MSERTEIIAELGVNHNGDLQLVYEMIAAAAAAGADTVKLQTYRADAVMTASTPLADYMKRGDTTSFLELARKLELPEDCLGELQAYAAHHGVRLLSSPFDVPSLWLLARSGMKRLKLPSGELVNPLMLQAAAATGLPLIVSTGMANLEEVCWAVNKLQEQQAGPITLLHCLTQYPAEACHCNLRAMATMREATGLPVGYSDHTTGWTVAVAAVAMGATVIEKHLTLDRSLPGPDQNASMTPGDFRAMVMAIREAESALGDGCKQPAPPELPLRPIVRKSLVLRQPLAAGSVLLPEMLTAKRPGNGIPARRFLDVIGCRVRHPVMADCPLQEDDLIYE